MVVSRTVLRYKNPIITTLFIVGAVVYIQSQEEGLALLSMVTLWHILLLSLLHFLALIFNSMFSGAVIRSADKPTRPSVLLYGTVVGALGNFFLPVGSGTALKAAVYKKHFNFTYSRFIALTLINYLLVFFLSSIVGFFSILAIREDLSAVVETLWLLTFAGVAVVSVLLFLFSEVSASLLEKNSLRRGRKRIMTIIENIEEGWRTFKKHPQLRLSLPLLVAANYLVVAFINYVAFLSVGESLSLLAALLFASVNAISLVFNITPGSIGVKEGLYIAAATAFNISAVAIIAAALIDRLVRFTLLAALVLILRLKVT